MSSEAIGAFKQAMGAVGIEPDEPIDEQLRSGQPFYFRATIDKPRQRKAWAVLHCDARPAGAFGHFKAGISERWRFDDAPPLTRTESRALKRRARDGRARQEAEQLASWEAAAAVCSERFAAAGAVDPLHGYLVEKAVSGEGLRQEGRRLLVPMYDAAGRLWNVQSIDPKGRKLFAKDARPKGLHLLIGDVADNLVIAEGYGTGAVIRRATAFPVAVAFCWSNLLATARAMRARFPRADIVIGADDDAHLVDHPTIRRNIGVDAARAAAQAIGGRLAVPPRRTP